MAATDPNRIDISLALLPGESEIVIKDLIEQLTAISSQMRAMMSGDEYAPVQGVMARTGTTASQDKPLDVHIVGVSPTASFAMPPNAERAKEKLGAAEAAARSAGGVVLEPTAEMEKVDNASQSTVTPIGGGPLPDASIREATAEEDTRGRIRRITDQLIARKQTEEGEDIGGFKGVDVGGTFKKSRGVADEIRDYAMTYGVFQGAHRGANSEVDQLKRSFTAGNIEDIGTMVGGESAPTVDLGPLGENVIPGTKYFQALTGLLGIGDNDKSAAAKGARIEAQSAWDAKDLPYLNQEEARSLTHGAIGRGWTEDEADRDRNNFSRLRDQNRGLVPLDARTYGDMTEEVRRDGATSMNDLNKALKAMPSAAKAARMELNEFAADSTKLAQQLKAGGATYGRAAQAGPEWAAQTGMAPSVMGAALDNPMVQGTLAQSGLMPQIKGLASASEVSGATQEMVRQVYDTTRAGMTDDVKKTEHGTFVQRTAEEKARAMTSTTLGLPPGTIEKFLNMEKTGAGDVKSDAMDEITGYGRQTASIEKNLQGDALSRARRAMRTGEGAAAESITRPEIMESLRKAGASEKDLKKVSSAKSATDFQAAARDAIGTATAKETDKAPSNAQTVNEVIVEVQATGALKNLLSTKVVKNEQHKKATKERDRGRGSYNFNNPDGIPPDKGNPFNPFD